MLRRVLPLSLVWITGVGCVKDEPVPPRAGSPATAPSRDVRTVEGAPSPEVAAANNGTPAASEGTPTNAELFAARDPVVAVPTEVTLLEPGSEPRTPLRITAKPGTRRAVAIELGLSVAMQVGDREVPPTRLPALRVALDTEVVGHDDTRTTIAIVVTDVVVPADAPSARVKDAITRTADSLRATKGRIVLAADGRIEGFELASDAAGRAAPLEPELGGLTAALQEMLPVLPREPIGNGARWRSVQQLRRDSVTLQQVASWSASRSADGTFTLVASSEHDLVAPAAGEPAGMIEAQSGTTSSRIVWDREAALPRTAEAEVATRTRADLQPLGAAQRASMRVDLSLRLVDVAP